MQKSYTYLALGDSYTIGEAVLLTESFPYQAVQMLRGEGLHFTAPEIVAKTGWTTEELEAGMSGYQFSEKYDFVTLLIGVNNQYRNLDMILYKDQFESLLKKSIALANGKKEHVLVISIPDYSVTPFARQKDGDKISKEIEAYNSLNKAISIQYKVAYIDITDDFKEAKKEPALVAHDGLHPSAEAYTFWAKKLAEAISRQLKK